MWFVLLDSAFANHCKGEGPNLVLESLVPTAPEARGNCVARGFSGSILISTQPSDHECPLIGHGKVILWDGPGLGLEKAVMRAGFVDLRNACTVRSVARFGNLPL